MTTMRKLIDIVNETYIVDSVTVNKRRLADDLKKISGGDIVLTWDELTNQILDAEHSDNPESRKEVAYLRELEGALYDKQKTAQEQYRRLEQLADEYDQTHFDLTLGVILESVVEDVHEFMSEQNVNYWPTLLGATRNQIDSHGIDARCRCQSCSHRSRTAGPG